MNPLHCPSIELCKEATKLGFPKTVSLWYECKIEGNTESCDEYFCPSVIEILKELPGEIKEYYLSIVKQTDGTYDVCYQELFVQGELHNTEGEIQNALLSMWIWLKKEGLLTNK